MSRRSVTALAAAALLVPCLPVAAGPVATWVVSVAPGFSAARLPDGVRLTGSFDAVHMITVDAAPSQMRELAATQGVRGIAPDARVETTGFGGGKGPAVFAPTAVGGVAGQWNAGTGVTVAVVDTGVADTAALSRGSGRLVSGPDFSGDTSGVRDGYGHGTFMADLVAGGKVSGQVIGIAPAANVVDVKVADSSGASSLAKVVRGLNWVAGQGVSQGISVVSLSLAADRPDSVYGSDPLTDAAEAVQRAGAVVVVSAGNDPTKVGDPGFDPSLLSVGAADTSGTSPVLAPFSGRATVAGEQRPDVVAPGVHLVSMLPSGSALAQANPDSAYGAGYRGTGTSQATAVLAGEVAAFVSGRGAVAPQDVRESFARAATPLGDGSGHGLATIPTSVSHGTGGQASPPPSGATDGSTTTTSSSWSSSSWSSSSWSSSSWSSSSWSSSSWSSSSWSSSSWSSTQWQ